MRTYDGRVDTVVAGTDITVDSTDPANPIITYSGVAASDTNIYNSDGTVSAARVVTIDTGSGGSLNFSNVIGYSADVSNLVSGNNIPTVKYVEDRIGGKLLGSLPKNPVTANDGWGLSWDDSNNYYSLKEFGDAYKIMGFGGDTPILGPGLAEDGFAITWDNTNSQWTLSGVATDTTLVGNATTTELKTPGAPQDGYVIVWDNNNSQWTVTAHDPNSIAGQPVSGTMVGVGAPEDGYAITWDDINSNWTVSDVSALTGETFKVSANDTTAGYLEDKLVNGYGIQVSTLNDGADEDLQVKMGPHYLSLASTGLYDGAQLSINADNTKFDLSAGEGFYIDSTTGAWPTITPQGVTITAKTAVSVTNIASQPVTYITVDKDDNIVQRGTYPTAEQRRNEIFIGVVVHSDNATVNAVNNLPSVALDITAQLRDVMEGLGFFNLSGNIISANGSNLSIDKSSGTAFKAGANFSNNKKDPNTLTLSSQTVATFRYRQEDGTEGSNVTVIDPTLYEDVGTNTLTTVPAGNDATIQRVYIFPSNIIRVMYGQEVFATLAAAVDEIGTESFSVEDNIAENGLLLASIAVRKDCTDLSDPQRAKIFVASRFGEFGPVGSSATTDLQDAYNNSAEPEIVLNTGGNGINIEDAATPLGTDLFTVASNGGGTKYLNVTDDGVSVSALQVDGQVSLGSETELTIATGAITATKAYHTVDTEADAATDDLDTINGGSTGDILILRPANDARTVVVKDGTGNLLLNTDCSMDSASDTITLLYDGTQWLETARSNNG